ncbi:GNAT family protein [Bacillus fonticola]|uniref:GNAT family N-acetyltransferase n=1 Tax=Bacillus fonticola TaxID=2728853 RepID=UPI001473C810|nr:GNAT family N-acetyltransferase [Bacillus fonticola]
MLFSTRTFYEHYIKSLIQTNIDYITTKQKVVPEANAAYLLEGEAIAVFGGKVDFMDCVLGLGTTQQVTHKQMEKLEDFYHSCNGVPAVEVTPFADPTLLEVIQERGYAMTETEQVWGLNMEKWMDTETDTASVAPVPVRRMGEYIESFQKGFGLEGEGLQSAKEYVTTIFHAPHHHPLAIEQNGKYATTGLFQTMDDIAFLSSTSTKPKSRGKGFQTTMLQARLRMAKEAGSQVAIIESVAGSASARNIERARFQVLYTKMKWDKK